MLEYNTNEFTDHINSLNANIKITTEPEQNGKLSYLDTYIHVNDASSTKVTVCRKPTHTDQYINFNSNHHLEHTRSEVTTSADRVDKLVTTPEGKKEELKHVKAALRTNGYKDWMY